VEKRNERSLLVHRDSNPCREGAQADDHGHRDSATRPRAVIVGSRINTGHGGILAAEAIGRLDSAHSTPTNGRSIPQDMPLRRFARAGVQVAEGHALRPPMPRSAHCR